MLNLVEVHIVNLVEMKGLMNLARDGVLVMLVTNSLVGRPTYNSLDTKFSNNHTSSNYLSNPEYSLFIDDPKAMPYSKLQSITDKAFSVIQTPGYISEESQLARSYVESKDNPQAKSYADARGLHQIMRTSWYEVMKENFDKAYDPLLNSIASLKHIRVIDNYLRQNYSRFEKLPVEKKFDLINASYNGGHGRLMQRGWNIRRMPRETREYVKKMRERLPLERQKNYYIHSLLTDNYKY